MLGLAVAFVLSGLVGLVLGAAVAADAGRDGETDMQARFEAELHSPALLAQLTILSLVVALLSGAVTAWHGPGAPYLNAGIVGAIGTLAGLTLPSPGFPPRLRRAMALATLPFTLAGAWAFVFFTAAPLA